MIAAAVLRWRAISLLCLWVCIRTVTAHRHTAAQELNATLDVILITTKE